MRLLRPLLIAITLAGVLSPTACSTPPVSRPKKARQRIWNEQQGIATLANGATYNAVMIWPAESHDGYYADLEREVEAYRSATPGAIK